MAETEIGQDIAPSTDDDRADEKVQYTIADVAGLYGVSVRTLRFYEDRGLLAPRRVGTARVYGPRDRIRLELILKGKRLGYNLEEIQDLITKVEQAHPTLRATTHPAILTNATKTFGDEKKRCAG